VGPAGGATSEDHIHYEHFKAAGLPIGSGLVESACKWLIQQRFKGVGMRWSEAEFNHLLQLRLAWVNQRIESTGMMGFKTASGPLHHRNSPCHA